MDLSHDELRSADWVIAHNTKDSQDEAAGPPATPLPSTTDYDDWATSPEGRAEVWRVLRGIDAGAS